MLPNQYTEQVHLTILDAVTWIGEEVQWAEICTDLGAWQSLLNRRRDRLEEYQPCFVLVEFRVVVQFLGGGTDCHRYRRVYATFFAGSCCLIAS